MARVVRFHEIGEPEVLKIEEVDVPPPGKGEVQIAVKALGLNRAEVITRDLTIRGYKIIEVTSDPERRERRKPFINEGLAEGSLKPLIARTFPLDQIVEAHRYLESNQHIGKVVVTV
ncbi:MAG: hypothetical protein QOE66_3010 [Chloroflexota bacterium]|jgi:NADPH:quinone reductase-like Zn-dependent oxidoreductase|nr:hypothetical protein [Chloroflexota bacterium]